MKILIRLIAVTDILIFVIVCGFTKNPGTDELSPVGRVKEKIRVIEIIIGQYYKSTGQYPKKLEDLQRCPSGLEDRWVGPYIREIYLTDSWRNRFIYEPNNLHPSGYNVISYGADGKPGGEGYNADIYNE